MSATSGLPAGWAAYQSPDGRWYYSHAASGVTQWHPPGHPSAPPPPQQYQQHHQHHQHYQQHQHQQHQHQQHQHQHQHQPQHHGSHSSKYIYNTRVEFKLKEKAFSLSGDAFSVKRVDTGEPVFKIRGNAFSFRDSKTLMDRSSNPLFKMNESIISLRGRMQIIDASTRTPVMTLRKKGFIPMFGTSTVQAWSGATDEGAPLYEIKGDIFRKDFAVRHVPSGVSCAQIRRKSFTLTNLLLEKDTYIISVEPGHDASLLVFLVIAVDEQYRDDGERRGYSSLF